jgi:hypothetical protein
MRATYDGRDRLRERSLAVEVVGGEEGCTGRGNGTRTVASGELGRRRGERRRREDRRFGRAGQERGAGDGRHRSGEQATATRCAGAGRCTGCAGARAGDVRLRDVRQRRDC